MEKEIVLITGASSGFGFLTTLHLAKKGYYVLATMRDLGKEEHLLSVAERLKVLENIEIIQLDVNNPQQILDIQHYVEKKFKKLDILINNAGYCLGGITEYANMNEWQLQLETNVLSVVAITKAFIPLMRIRKAGKIINLGSVSGQFGFPGMGPYVTSKFALSGFSESLRLELAPFHIYVSIIEAGSFKTNIWEKSLNSANLNGDTDYNDFTKFIYNQAMQTANNAGDPDKVIQLIEKICITKKPKLRYPIGKRVRTMIVLKSIIPWAWIEAIYLRKLKKAKS